MNTQQEGSCLQAKVVGLRRHHTSHYLDTGLLTSQTVRRLLLFKPHSLAFVTVSWANSYRTVFGPAHIVVQSLSCVRLFATPWTAAHQTALSITVSRSLLKLMSIESVMPPNHLILCSLLLLPSIFPSIRIFSSESVLHIRWPKYWNFSLDTSILLHQATVPIIVSVLGNHICF